LEVTLTIGSDSQDEVSQFQCLAEPLLSTQLRKDAPSKSGRLGCCVEYHLITRSQLPWNPPNDAGILLPTTMPTPLMRRKASEWDHAA